MLPTLFPRPRPALQLEYRRVCNNNNLKYVWYFSLLCCAIFIFHLIHHFRLGLDAFSTEMMPYTLLYSFCILYPALNLLVLAKIKDLPALVRVATFIELAFPAFMAGVAVILSVMGAHMGQGITPFAIILLAICFLLQGHFVFLFWLLSISWVALTAGLLLTMPMDIASPFIAIGFSSSLVCVLIANLAENMRVDQFVAIAELSSKNRQLQLLSSQDHLTGLLNRRSFDRTLERELARSDRFGHPLSLLMIDIDNFKSINDTYGHVYGDDIIKKVARCIKVHVRDVDYVGRMGGDEFVVLLIETDCNYAMQVAERMRREVSRLMEEEEAKSVTISVGHAQCEGESLTAFLERADKALYQAKKAGKNQIKSLLTERAG